MLTVDEGIAAYYRLMRGDEAARAELDEAGVLPRLPYHERDKLTLESMVGEWVKARLDLRSMLRVWDAVQADRDYHRERERTLQGMPGLSEWLMARSALARQAAR